MCKTGPLRAIVKPVRPESRPLFIAAATVAVLRGLSDEVSLLTVTPSTVTEYVVLSVTWLKNTIAWVPLPADKVESIAAVILVLTTKVKSAIVIVFICDLGVVQER